MKTRKIALLALILVILGTLVAACGPSAEQVYGDKILGPINTYAAKFSDFGNVISASKLDDPAWQKQATKAMDDLDKAATDLGSVPTTDVPDKFKAIDGYLKELASSTPTMTQAIRDSLKEYNAGNNDGAVAKMDEATAELQKLSDTLNKLNAEVDKLNK